MKRLLEKRKSKPSNGRKVIMSGVDFATQHAANIELARKQQERERQKQRQVHEEQERVVLQRKESTEKAAECIRSSPVTEQQSRHAPPSKRAFEVEKVLPPVVWEDCFYGEAQPETLTARAAREADTVPYVMEKKTILSAFKDGMVLIADGEHRFRTSGLDGPWFRSGKWRQLCSKVVVTESPTARKADVRGSDGLSLTKIGIGTYNCVVALSDGAMPDFVPRGAVLRLTRNDYSNDTKDYKYPSVCSAVDEAVNTLFCSMNGIGIPVYSVCAYTAPRTTTGLRYGVAYTQEQADMDMHRAMDRATTFEEGERTARACIDLLFRASRLGVACFDIKCSNILRIAGLNRESPEFVLVDCDAQFFVVNAALDWRALLLLNLALLTAHVRNGQFGDPSRGFAKVAWPVLDQLISRRHEYDSEWLFGAPAVDIEFDILLGKTTFDLQKVLAIMATSYFYGKNADPTSRSKTAFTWKIANTKVLKEFWKTPTNRRTWPHWHQSTPPLIEQLVGFGTERVRKSRV